MRTLTRSFLAGWAAVLHVLRTRERQLEPDAFIANVRLYRPDVLDARWIGEAKPGSVDPNSYRLEFETSVGGRPVRFVTIFDAGVIPWSHERTLIAMSTQKGSYVSWDALTDTQKILIRLVQRFAMGEYRVRGDCFSGTIARPAEAITKALAPREKATVAA